MSFVELKDVEERYPYIPHDELEQLLKKFNGRTQSSRTCEKFHEKLKRENDKHDSRDLKRYGPRDLVDMNVLIEQDVLYDVLLEFPTDIIGIVSSYGECDEDDVIELIENQTGCTTTKPRHCTLFMISHKIHVGLNKREVSISCGYNSDYVFEMNQLGFRNSVKEALENNSIEHSLCVVAMRIIYLWRCYNYSMCF